MITRKSLFAVGLLASAGLLACATRTPARVSATAPEAAPTISASAQQGMAQAATVPAEYPTAPDDPWATPHPAPSSQLPIGPSCVQSEDCLAMSACGGFECVQGHCQPERGSRRCVLEVDGRVEEGLCAAGRCLLEAEWPRRCGTAGPWTAIAFSHIKPSPSCQTEPCRAARERLKTLRSQTVSNFVDCLGGVGSFAPLEPDWDGQGPYVLRVSPEPETGGRPPQSGTLQSKP
jgi:hypothetical protein